MKYKIIILFVLLGSDCLAQTRPVHRRAVTMSSEDQQEMHQLKAQLARENQTYIIDSRDPDRNNLGMAVTLGRDRRRIRQIEKRIDEIKYKYHIE